MNVSVHSLKSKECVLLSVVACTDLNRGVRYILPSNYFFLSLYAPLLL